MKRTQIYRKNRVSRAILRTLTVAFITIIIGTIVLATVNQELIKMIADNIINVVVAATIATICLFALAIYQSSCMKKADDVFLNEVGRRVKYSNIIIGKTDSDQITIWKNWYDDEVKVDNLQRDIKGLSKEAGLSYEINVADMPFFSCWQDKERFCKKKLN